MGPREALERIRTLIRDALAAGDIKTAHALLREMNAIAETAIGRGTLRSGRLIREKIRA